MLSLACLLFGLTHCVYAASHVVSLPHSKYAGSSLSNGVSQWLGIPFAAPPVGDLRFAPPIDPPTTSGIQSADTQGPLCIATGSGAIPHGQSEDCLYLAVYAPTSATSTSKLPVFVFIQGGGFNSNANPNLNGTGLVEASGNNIIVVTFNYRVGPWGFLSSPSTISNNGLRDQRKALQWVQSHISQFGGDPGHVTLGGDSAGAASIALQMAAYGGRNDNLFHAAAAESVSFATVLTPSEAQYQYDTFTRTLGCSHDSDPLACLRSKSASEVGSQNFNVPYPGQKHAPLFMFSPTLDGDFVTDLTYTAFATGKFVNIPVIVGDDTNGGTVFAPKDATCLADSDDFLTSQFPYITPNQLSDINKLYPKPDHCPLDKCWWRQASNAYGEIRYMCPSLYITSAVANVSSPTTSKKITRHLPPVLPPIGGGSIIRTKSKSNTNTAPITHANLMTSTPGGGNAGTSYSYRYNVEDPTQMSLGLGVPHTTELSAIFGPSNMPHGVAPESYYPSKSNAPVVPVMQAYWTSFIRTYDPNVHRAPGSTRWDRYYGGDGAPQRLIFQSGGVTAMEAVDAGLRERCAYLWGIGSFIRQGK